MYKIGEVANMLNVEKVVIFEKLISKSKEIEPYITKEKGITYFSEFGVKVIDALIYGRPIPVEEKEEVPTQELHEEKDVIDEDFISDEDIVSINEERKRIKKEIMNSRNKLIELDGLHKQLDEAIRHYQISIKEDLDWIKVAESKVSYKFKSQ